MRHLATFGVLGALLLSPVAASAQGATQEHPPPTARPLPPARTPQLIQPGQRLDRATMLHYRQINQQSRELLLREVRLLERLVGPLPRAPSATSP